MRLRSGLGIRLCTKPASIVEWIARGYRPHRQDHYSFNLGIGGTLDLDTRVLGDGLIANEPLPPRETTARTKQTPAAGLLVLFSVGWDLAAPHRTPPHNRPSFVGYDRSPPHPRTH